MKKLFFSLPLLLALAAAAWGFTKSDPIIFDSTHYFERYGPTLWGADASKRWSLNHMVSSALISNGQHCYYTSVMSDWVHGAIGFSYSGNGVDITHYGIILDTATLPGLYCDSSASTPLVIKFGPAFYVMIYRTVGTGTNGKACLARATGTDSINFTRYNNGTPVFVPPATGWDSSMVQPGHGYLWIGDTLAFPISGMTNTADQTTYATGWVWTIDSGKTIHEYDNNPVLTGLGPGHRCRNVFEPCPFKSGSTYYMLVQCNSVPDSDKTQICIASSQYHNKNWSLVSETPVIPHTAAKSYTECPVLEPDDGWRRKVCFAEGEGILLSSFAWYIDPLTQHSQMLSPYDRQKWKVSIAAGAFGATVQNFIYPFPQSALPALYCGLSNRRDSKIYDSVGTALSTTYEDSAHLIDWSGTGLAAAHKYFLGTGSFVTNKYDSTVWRNAKCAVAWLMDIGPLAISNPPAYYDHSGYGHTLSEYNTAPYITNISGSAGRALKLPHAASDGPYLYTNDADDLSFCSAVADSPFTLMARIKIDTAKYTFDINKSDLATNNVEWWYGVDSANNNQNLAFGTPTIGAYIYGHAPFDPSNKWYQYAFTYTGSGASSGINQYRDKTLITTVRTGVGTYAHMTPGPSKLYINKWTGNGRTGAGSIGRFLLMHRVVDTSEIFAHSRFGNAIDSGIISNLVTLSLCPVIFSQSKTSAKAGDTIRFAGSGYDSSGLTATINALSMGIQHEGIDTAVKAVVPAGLTAGKYPIVITNKWGESTTSDSVTITVTAGGSGYQIIKNKRIIFFR